ncbi:MAG: hypothetical protein P1V20_22595 [Verrucomicrobiales bacterium]|nr:hypothetical protein [Verrucomicrobiales bacterium]
MVDFAGIDEVELAGLEARVRELQDLFGKRDVSSLSTNMLAGAEIAAAEKRIGELEQDVSGIGGEKERKEAERYQNLVAGYLVQNETRLTASEQAQYGAFLAKDFFIRDDFDELDQFYASAHSKLSERGKSEMSSRVWNGIREGEYEFTDLPKNVREKEMERLYGLLSDPAKMSENLKQIPEKDRDEFIAAYQSGDSDRTAQILNRDSFKETVSVSNFDVSTGKEEIQTNQRSASEISKNSSRIEQESVKPSDLEKAKSELSDLSISL